MSLVQKRSLENTVDLYFNLWWELALETSATASFICSLQVHDLDHSYLQVFNCHNSVVKGMKKCLESELLARALCICLTLYFCTLHLILLTIVLICCAYLISPECVCVCVCVCKVCVCVCMCVCVCVCVYMC